MSTGDDESKGSSFIHETNELKATGHLVEHATVSYERPLVTVTCSDVCFTIPAKRLSQKIFPYTLTQQQRDDNITMTPFDVNEGYELLHNISFVAKPYELTAIMGPSGCGKTTFMNIMAQRATGTVKGVVAYNNVLATPRNLKGCMSMCYSTDRLLPYLTVEETLHFATILKMGQTTSQQRRQRVNEVIEEMALAHVRHTRVGGVWQKGLSSGEVRRTSIAVELIGDPAVLLLDEPTSGLDAVLAFEIIFVLKALASKGRTIICSLHQPRVAIYDMLDTVMLVSNGRCLFHGSAKDARRHLQDISLVAFPPKLNTADALIEVASAPRAKVKSVVDEYESSVHHANLKEEISRIRSIEASGIRFHERNSYIQWFVEVGAVCFRTFRNSMRNPLSFSVLLIIQTLMGLFLGAFFFDIPGHFLPDVIPPTAGDPEGSLMKFFDNDLIRYMNTGINGTGYDPFLELLISGPDGNMSEPFLRLSETSLFQNMYNNLDCAHERFELGFAGYNDTSFEDYWEMWGETGEGDDIYAEGTTYSPPALATYLLKIFQVFDFLLDKYDWRNILAFLKFKNTSMLYAQVACKTDLREIAGVMSGCQGVPYTPIMRYSVPGGGGMLSIACTNSGGITEDPANRTAAHRRIASSDSPQDDRNSNSHERWDTSALADWPAVWQSEVERHEQSVSLENASGEGQKRRLQALALMGSSDFNLGEVLPPVLAHIVERLPTYSEAFTTCDHEFCRLMSEQQQAESTNPGSVSNFIAALGQYGAVMGAVLNIVGALFFAVGNSGFASYDALVSIPQERVMINREMANNLYRPSSYFVGKVIADATFQFVPAICLSLAFYLLIGVDLGKHGYFLWCYLGICILMIFAAYGFAYLVSALSPNMEVAVIAAPLILVVFHACAGFFVRDDALPVWMSWIKYLSYYRWGFFGLVLNQFPVEESWNGLPNSFTLALIGVSERRMWVNCLALIILGIVYRILAYFPLKYMHRKIGIEH